MSKFDLIGALDRNMNRAAKLSGPEVQEAATLRDTVLTMFEELKWTRRRLTNRGVSSDSIGQLLASIEGGEAST